MTRSEDTYAAFMLDYAAGNQSPAIALAGDLHVLLSDEGAETWEMWNSISEELRGGSKADDAASRMDAACGVLNTPVDAFSWRRGLSGAYYTKGPIAGGKMMKLRPGKSVPTHGHKHMEITIVLSGQLTDGVGVYEKGDIMFGLPGERHKPAAHGDEDCICYVAKVERDN